MQPAPYPPEKKILLSPIGTGVGTFAKSTVHSVVFQRMRPSEARTPTTPPLAQ